jgi:hypothetical protein
MKRTRGLSVLLGGASLVWVTTGCHHARSKVPTPPVPPAEVAALRPLRSDDPLERLATEQPLGFLKTCRDHCAATVRDYTCQFHMRERIDDSKPGLGPPQQISIRFREQPYSVDMRWVQNAVHASRVNFVKGRWRRGERELALIVPAGLLNLLAPAGVRLDVHAPELKQASSRSIDDFGFKRTLESIIARCEQAQSEPRFDLRAVGVGTFDGRECIVLERRLPYDGPGGLYPDRLFIMHIDREWLVPLSCDAFADDAGNTPIGIYETREVRLNVGLGDEDF